MKQRGGVDGTMPPCLEIGSFKSVKTGSIVDGASASFNFFVPSMWFFVSGMLNSVKQRCPVDGTSGSFLFFRAILLVFGYSKQHTQVKGMAQRFALAPSIQYFFEGNHASQSRWRKCHLKMRF